MEMFAIMASVPAAFVASTLYCMLLEKVVSKSERVSRLLRRGSYAVLALFVVEIVLLLTIGAVRLGPAIETAHLVVFFLGPPALANLIVLRRGHFEKWGVAVFLCTAFAFCLVMMQYTIAESLYGIDDVGGPYRRSSTESVGLVRD